MTRYGGRHGGARRAWVESLVVALILAVGPGAGEPAAPHSMPPVSVPARGAEHAPVGLEPGSPPDGVAWSPAGACTDTARTPSGGTVARIFSGTANYQDAAGAWQRCDTRIVPEIFGEWTHAVWKAPYRARFRTDRPRWKLDANGEYVIYELVGLDRADSCTIKDNTITWHLPGSVDLQIVCAPATAKATVILKDAEAPTTFSFWYHTSAKNIEARAIGSAESGRVVFSSDGRIPFWIPALHAEDAAGNTVPVQTDLALGTLTVILDTKGAVYPIYLDPSTTINGDGDASDAFRRIITGTQWNLATNYMRIGEQSGSYYDLYVSFPIEVDIIHASQIDSVALFLETALKETTTDTLKSVARIAQIEDAPFVESDTSAYNAVSWTTANTLVIWSGAVGSWQEINLSMSFSEWLSDYTHSGDDRVGIRVAASELATKSKHYRNISEYTGSAQYRPYLYIEYTPIQAPTGFTLTALSANSVKCEWADNSSIEDGFYVDTSADSIAVDDSTAAGVTCDTIIGLTPNVKCPWLVVVYKETARNYSVPDTAFTWANTPGQMTVTAIGPTLLKFALNVNGNPAHTHFAIQDSVSGKLVDVNGDTLRTGTIHADTTWEWGTYTEWGGASGDTLTGLSPAVLYNLRAAAKSGE